MAWIMKDIFLINGDNWGELMSTLAEWMTTFKSMQQNGDFPRMAHCLMAAREALYGTSEPSEDSELYLKNFLDVFVWCAFAELENGNGEAALSYLATAEEIVDRVYGKRQMLLVCYKGYAYQQLGMYAEAEQCFLEYLAHEPQDETVFFRLGNVAAHQQQWDKALEAYDHALRIKKNYREARLNIGIVARWLGDEETAEAMALDEELRQRIFNDSELEEDPGRYSLVMNPDIGRYRYLSTPGIVYHFCVNKLIGCWWLATVTSTFWIMIQPIRHCWSIIKILKKKLMSFI